MTVRVWIYNYDFEFELAKQRPLTFGSKQVLPWWFLNRSSAFLIPFSSKNDVILTYQLPDPAILAQLRKKAGFLPEFIVVSFNEPESNAIIRDLKNSDFRIKIPTEFVLSPWGWSPEAFELSRKMAVNHLPDSFCSAVELANSKKTSDDIRKSRLPDSYKIRSLQIANPDISLQCLKDEIYSFISRYSRVKIKNYFGVSGKLSNTIGNSAITDKKLKLWKSWIVKSGGLLLEEELDLEAEYSIQAEINQNGRSDILTLTRLYSNKNGSYLGNMLDKTNDNLLNQLAPQFAPLFSQLSDSGYRGPLGIDLLQTTDQIFKLVEINARLTMGRVAYEWNQRVNDQKIGFFSNFFINFSNYRNVEALMSDCNVLEKRFDCNISIINFVPSIQKASILVTIFIAANTKKSISEALNKIHPQLFQNLLT